MSAPATDASYYSVTFSQKLLRKMHHSQYHPDWVLLITKKCWYSEEETLQDCRNQKSSLLCPNPNHLLDHDVRDCDVRDCAFSLSSHYNWVHSHCDRVGCEGSLPQWRCCSRNASSCLDSLKGFGSVDDDFDICLGYLWRGASLRGYYHHALGNDFLRLNFEAAYYFCCWFNGCCLFAD